MCEIIGRKQELKILKACRESGKPEFVAIYGRRRVGKTFLVTRAFGNEITFSHTGLAPVRKKKNTLKNQLQNFYFSLLRAGAVVETEPRSWLEAFFLLQQFLDRTDNGTRQTVFIDEVSWMDTPRSNFTSALEAFWNGWGNRRNNLMLVICSSATSWMLDNVINDENGFYRRLTETIHLSPFNLSECEQFLKRNGFRMTRDDVLQTYMVLGGVPYYLNLFQKGLSVAQNIDRLFYGGKPKLEGEYDYLFSAIFRNAQTHKRVIELLAGKRLGYSRKEIADKLGLTENGEFYSVLTALEKSDFVTEYHPFGENGAKGTLLRLKDSFCLFWLHFNVKHDTGQEDYWLRNHDSPDVRTWQGYAFEDVCFNHVPQIKKALGVSGVNTETSSLTVNGDGKKPGMQIDMLLTRDDNVVNLCEMKYTKGPFTVNKEYDEKMKNRIDSVMDIAPGRAVHSTLVCPLGVKENEYSGVFQSVITMDDLFG